MFSSKFHSLCKNKLQNVVVQALFIKNHILKQSVFLNESFAKTHLPK